MPQRLTMRHRLHLLLLSVSALALGCGHAGAQGAGFLIEGAPAAPL
ncbi:MAG: hypothetical protein JWN93_2796, partial [Hyphomicrobiales bacterium]|nr:hypothetical protein [Hyphomicrobiales bacterium]